MADHYNEAAETDGIPERVGADLIAHELRSPDAHPEDTMLGITPDGGVAAWGDVWMRRDTVGERRAYVRTTISPQWRDRGIEEPLLDWTITRAEQLLRSVETGEPKYVCRFTYDFVTRDITPLRRRGFQPVRYFFEMERNLAIAIPDPQVPDAVRIEPWQPRHHRGAHSVRNAAFADHWGSTPVTWESWEHDTLGKPNFRIDLSFVALVEEAVVGYSFNSVYPEDCEAAGRMEAWIESLGVVREWRKRGIATALLLASFQAMAGEFEFAMLGVDAANPTGALGLYESVGFEVKYRLLTMQRTVP